MATIPFLGAETSVNDTPYLGSPADIANLDGVERRSDKGVANGYAPLDGFGKVPQGNLPDTASLDAEVDGKITTHNSATTSVHGIANTANLVLTNDARLADTRDPKAHTHPISDVTNLQTALDTKSPLAGVQWTDRHTNSTGNPYVIGSIVYHNGRVYRCIATNDSMPPQQGGNPYWADLGVGYLLPNENPLIVGGSINTAGGVPYSSPEEIYSGNGLGASGGSIDLRGGNGGADGASGAGGSIQMKGGNGDDGIGGAGGSIFMNGSIHDGHSGSINLSATPDANGGSINLSAGASGPYYAGAGGSITSIGSAGTDPGNGDPPARYAGGSIIMSAGENGSGGSINTSDGGGSLDMSGGIGTAGGSINTSGGSFRTGGSINTSDGGGSINTFGVSGWIGGSIDTSAGGSGAGGSINTSNGGGSIDTQGVYIGSGAFGFNNTAKLRKGTTDALDGGSKGIALECSAQYELKWEAGRLYTMQQDGFTIRSVEHCMSAPTAQDDSTRGFVVGSRWIMDSGKTYACTDNEYDEAVWELKFSQENPNPNGPAGYINTSGDSGGSSGGYIDTSATNGGSNGGYINTTGSDGYGGNIDTRGSSSGYSGGSINTSAGADASGGSINTSNGGGSINTSGGGGSILTSGMSSANYSSIGGKIDLRALMDETSNGGSIISTGNNGYSGGTLNMSAGGTNNGGSIDTRGGGEGNGGSINISNGGGSINTSLRGGSINISLNGGSINLSDGGGSINTSGEGGSIDTRGTGSIQLGVIGRRTTLNGSASGGDLTITLPNTTGTIALTNDNRFTNERTPTSHTHGNITNAGAVGSTANLPLITTTSGVVTTGTFGTTANSFCQGNDARLGSQTIFTLAGEAKTTFALGTSYLYGCMPTRGPMVSGSYTSAVLRILGNFTVTGISINQYLPSLTGATLTYQLVRVLDASTTQALGSSIAVAGNNNLTTSASSISASLNSGDQIGLMLTLGASGTVPSSAAATTILANIYCVPR